MEINEILDYSLFKVAKHEFRVITLVTLVLFILGVFIVTKVVRKAIFNRTSLDLPKKYSLYTIFKYIAVVMAVAISLQIVGIDITVLLAGSAALLVGVGFGLQNLFGDVTSGIILLFDSTIKVNDVIEVDGIVGRVVQSYVNPNCLTEGKLDMRKANPIIWATGGDFNYYRLGDRIIAGEKEED